MSRKDPNRPVANKLGTKKVDKAWRLFAEHRSVAAVVREMHVSRPTIVKLRDELGWLARIEEMDRRVAEVADDAEVERRKKLLEQQYTTHDKLVKNLDYAECGTVPATATAMTQVVKTIQLLQGEPTDRPEVSLLDHLEKQYDDYHREKAATAKRRAELKKEKEGK